MKSIYFLRSVAVLCAFLITTFFNPYKMQAQNCSNQYQTYLTIKKWPIVDVYFSQISKTIFLFKKVEFIIKTEHPLFIDFGDGNGSRYVDDGKVITIYYSNYGIKNLHFTGINIQPQSKTILIKTQAGNESVNYQSPDMILKLQTKTPFVPPVAYYPPENPYSQSTYGYANAYIRFANKQTQYTDQIAQGKKPYLCSPLIFIEGLDFGTAIVCDDNVDPYSGTSTVQLGKFGWPQFTLGTSDDDPTGGEGGYDQLRLMPHQIKKFIDQGRDIILLDFNDGADWIQKNSQLLQVLLEKVNEMKMGCVHPRPNIVIGASMGGQIARHGLAMMEQQGKCHETNTYVSFDSPHRGANIALGLQAAAWFNSKIENGDASGYNDLHKPAPQQLLFESIESAVSEGKVSLHSWGSDTLIMDLTNASLMRQKYDKEITELGMPQNTRNIAIADGSEIATTQGYADGSRFLRDVLKANVTGVFTGDVFQFQMAAVGGEQELKSQYHFKCSWNTVGNVSKTQSNVIFSGVSPSKFVEIFGSEVPCQYHAANFVANESCLKADAAPGGKRKGDMLDVHNFITKEFQMQKIKSSDLSCSEDYRPLHDNVSFIPTMSALDINWPLTTENLKKNIKDENILVNKLTPFHAYYATNEQHDGGVNLEHVELTQGMIDWLDTQIDQPKPGADYAVLPHISKGSSYNFGFRNNILKSVEIQSGGILGVNTCGATGFGDEPEAILSYFDVRTACDAVINVYEGGTVNVGDLTCAHSGGLFLSSGSTMHLFRGSVLNIVHTGSSLIVEPGATLIIDDGAIIRISNGKDGLDDGNVMIHVKGAVQWTGEVQYSGNGYFRWAASNALSVNGWMSLQGIRKSCRLWHLEQGAEVNTGASTFYLDLGKVIYEPNSHILNKKLSFLSNLFCRSKYSQATMSNEIALKSIDEQGITVNNCTFQNIHTAIEAKNGKGGFFTMDNCEITHCLNGVVSQSIKNLLIENSHFVMQSAIIYGQVKFNGQAINSTNANTLTINNSSVTAYGGQLILNRPAIELTNVFFTRIYESQIDNNFHGISCPYNSKNNIYASYSSISHNNLGISMAGGKYNTGTSYGLVDLQCVSLITNEKGVSGKDILLYIDNGVNGRGSSANTFTNKLNGNLLSGKIFDIEYIQRTPSQILARYNLWGSGDPIMYRDYDFSGIPLVYLPKVIDLSGMCPRTTNPGTDGHLTDGDDCLETSLSNTPSSISSAFDLAYGNLMQGDLDNAILNFQEITNTFSDNSVTRNQFCQDKIEYALIFSTPIGSTGDLGERSSINQQNKDLIIFPNPTNNKFRINSHQPVSHIIIKDQFSNILLDKFIKKHEEIDVSSWPSGLYIVTDASSPNQYYKLIKV
ncbi:MAG: hypothetical protein KA143_07890 [Saprospiraceae bacterium]|nr:hypothetical protein [Saprospiraceae bacterium]